MGITDMMLPWKKKKLIRYLNEAWGKPPEGEYDPGDMEDIRSFFDACRKDGRDPFYVDDTTWNDLDLESLYRRINACQCTAGEPYLYYMLRRPMNRETWEYQHGLIGLMEKNADARKNLQLLFRSLLTICSIGGNLLPTVPAGSLYKSPIVIITCHPRHIPA